MMSPPHTHTRCTPTPTHQEDAGRGQGAPQQAHNVGVVAGAQDLGLLQGAHSQATMLVDSYDTNKLMPIAINMPPEQHTPSPLTHICKGRKVPAGPAAVQPCAWAPVLVPAAQA
jgi:hypothetical protein